MIFDGMKIAGVNSLEGFICPACFVDFPSSRKLQEHWLKFHSPKGSLSTSSSNDYEEIPGDIPETNGAQVWHFYCAKVPVCWTFQTCCVSCSCRVSQVRSQRVGWSFIHVISQNLDISAVLKRNLASRRFKIALENFTNHLTLEAWEKY